MGKIPHRPWHPLGDGAAREKEQAEVHDNRALLFLVKGPRQLPSLYA
jgi:hypothetical protein